jgi:hypothetical protein
MGRLQQALPLRLGEKVQETLRRSDGQSTRMQHPNLPFFPAELMHDVHQRPRSAPNGLAGFSRKNCQKVGFSTENRENPDPTGFP